jgi:NAD(P)H dehydrogenase (quinone)
MTAYAITGATGQLGRLVVSSLASQIAPSQIVAIVRDPAKAALVLPRGVVVRRADYDHPETLGPALAGIDKLLLISAHEIGKRLPQHRAVIDAAKLAGVKLIVYTSILRADSSAIGIAEEHRKTEALLKASDVPYAVLRNGWYTENYTGTIAAALEHGGRFGGSGSGRISAATRADYAEAAVAVLLSSDDQRGRIYELAGDDAFTLDDFNAELSRQSGKPIAYRDLSESEHTTALAAVGVPPLFAGLIAQADAAAAHGALFDDGHQLSQLIGRRTTPLADAIASALRQRV